MKKKINKKEFELMANKLAYKISISKKNYSSIYPILRGGYNLAVYLSEKLEIPLTSEITENTLIVDDLIDSGKTLSQYSNDKAVLFVKNNNEKQVTFFADITNNWIDFYWEKENDILDNITRIFQYIGENPNREGLIDTPKRILGVWNETLKGYNPKLKPRITTFKNGTDGIKYEEMVLDNGNYYSYCEHHFLPFFGNYYFGYIPNKNGKILGLSKVARIVDYYSSKLQIQERLTSEIVNALWEKLCEDGINKPQGMILVMKGEHLCKSMRGIKKQGKMTTTYYKGVFSDKKNRNEFFLLSNII